MKPSGFNISFFDMKKAKQNFVSEIKHVVGYARLSFDEDGENFVSIENQMSILEEFYNQNYKDKTSTYTFVSDDNVSGYKFERNGLYQLFSLIENGKCNIIIAKDLSRIGRHGALTQLFIEQCEKVGVRIHAMSDYDSTKESDDLILGIRAWSNERVVKDTSAKIKKIVKHKQNNGTWFCGVPFGYYVINYQKGLVGIDEEASAIVKRIFNMYVNGSGINSIARTLTLEHVPTPNMFIKERAIANGDDCNKRISSRWSSTVISEMLENEFYIGTLITGRYQRDGINGRDMRTRKESWKKFENHHTPIIDKDVFMAAQEIKKNNKKYNTRTKNEREHLLHGIVFCGDCGSVQYAYSTPKISTQYICSNYFKYGKAVCSRHSVKESMLIDIAIDFLKLARESCKDAIDSLNGELSFKQTVKSDAETLDRMKKELNGLDTKLHVIEEQRIKQIIAHPEREESINNIYDKMIVDTEQKKSELESQIERLKDSLSSSTDAIKKAKTAMDIIDNVIKTGTLSRHALLAIFERITVYDNGSIDIQLRPYLRMLDPQNYSITMKHNNHHTDNYTITTEPERIINEISSGSPSRIRSVRRISFGITTRPSSSMRRTIPVARTNTASFFSCFWSAFLVWVARWGIFTSSGGKACHRADAASALLSERRQTVADRPDFALRRIAHAQVALIGGRIIHIGVEHRPDALGEERLRHAPHKAGGIAPIASHTPKSKKAASGRSLFRPALHFSSLFLRGRW